MQLLDSQNNVVGSFDSNSEVRVSGKKNTLTFNTKEGQTYKKITLDVESFKDFSIKKDDGSVIKLSDSTEESFNTIKQEFVSFIEQKATDEINENSEFKYVAIPGKIQKLFVHVGNISDITSIPEYADFETRESIQPGKSYRDGDGKFILDVDGVVRWFNNEKSFTISNVNETVFAIDVEITESSKYVDIFNALTNDERFVSKFFEGYTAAGIDFGDKTVKTVQDILKNQYYGSGAFIADSKVCFSTGSHFSSNGYGVFAGGITNSSEDSNIASFIQREEEVNNNCGNDYSETYNGIRLLKKAIETGRALDIAVPIPKESEEYSQYYDVFARV
jgi:hypothetical protein